MSHPYCPVTERYLDVCRTEGSQGLRRVTRDLRLGPHFTEAFAGRLLGRPLFVERGELRRVADRLTAFYTLLTSLPGRLFGGSVLDQCAELGISGRKAELLRGFADVPPSLYGRADLHRDGSTWKLLEFNVGSELGGMERASDVPRALLEVQRFQQFAQRHELDYVDTGDRIARMLKRAAASVSAGDDPVVVLLEADGRLARYARYIRPFQESMRARGVDLRLGELSQLRRRQGKIHLDGVPVDVLLRYVTLDQILEHASGEELLEPVLGAHGDGRTALVTPLSSCLYDNKGLLPMLSAPHRRAAFTSAELALIDELVPWTRAVTNGPVDVDAESVDLIDYCRAHRAELIVKPYDELRGGGILAGWEATDREWHRALQDSVGRKCVVQRKVQPAPERVCDPVTAVMTDWLATWGLYFTDEGYAGTYIRALPSHAASTVVSWDARPQFAGVFSYPDAARYSA